MSFLPTPVLVLAPLLALIFLTAAGALLLGAALHDLACRTIPNWIPAALALDGLALRVLSGQVLGGIASALVVFACAALLWRRGLMGGGDVKLLGAAALVVPSGAALAFVLAVALAGGGLALTYLALRRLVRAPRAGRPAGVLARIVRVERRRIRQCRSLPYGCAIAAGAFFVLGTQVLEAGWTA
jgi:prepilin peptidase CpaA